MAATMLQGDDGRERDSSGVTSTPPAERFLQQALGSQADVRIPSLIMSVALLLAVAFAWARRRARRAALEEEALDE